ncbi:MAG TPA: ABC transporter permease [Bacteroidota bacterium]|nr:ABC transporter permease [Bacteroidota bacterium]
MNIGPVVRKEFRQILRDKRALGILIFIPAFLLVLVGYALNFDVKHLRLAVYDEDKTRTSREFVASFVHSEYFTLNYVLRNKDEVDNVLNDGTAHIALIIPRDFSRNLLSGKETTVQVFIDGSNNNTASVASGYIAAGIQNYSRSILMQTIEKRGLALAVPIDVRPKLWYNPELKTTKYLVPGLFGLILMIVTAISTSLSVVREKELGTMEQLKTSPLKSYEIILGKAIPYVFIALLAATLIIVLGAILFDVRVQGSVLLLYSAIFIFLLAGLGQGLLISSIAQTQQVAFFASVFSSLLPAFLLSGFIFPIKSMPLFLQIISNVQATKFFLVIVRSVILKGVGIGAVWDQFIYLFLFAAVTIGISSVRLQRELSA